MFKYCVTLKKLSHHFNKYLIAYNFTHQIQNSNKKENVARRCYLFE